MYGLLLSVVLILIRLVWMFPGAYVAHLIRKGLLHQDVPRPPARGIFIVGWTGMRGVVALAAAISLPEILNDGSPFPQRDVMVFLTFCVIFVTLVLQGLTLPPLIHFLGLGGIAPDNIEERGARRAMIEAALAYLEHTRETDTDEFAPVYDELIRSQRRRLNVVESNNSAEYGYRPEDYELWKDLSRKIAALQRATILHLRNQNTINDAVMRKLERELDLFDARYTVPENA